MRCTIKTRAWLAGQLARQLRCPQRRQQLGTLLFIVLPCLPMGVAALLYVCSPPMAACVLALLFLGVAVALGLGCAIARRRIEPVDPFHSL